ncbi:glycosyl hydrolase family 61-domain-containing protein [Mycena olivaceomarginata]|nr:glycosyl hydrolase family 61-domain-containing protein [Mycena olivaceomarginata]
MESPPVGAPVSFDKFRTTCLWQISCWTRSFVAGGATPAALTATVTAGDTIYVTLGGPDDRQGTWIHEVGPLAACDTPCAGFKPTQKTQWFKISEQGTQSNGSWMQQQLYNGFPVNVSLPVNLKPGNYLLCHDVIALHMAQLVGGAELFPSFIQLAVTGDGTHELAGNECANFRGARRRRLIRDSL